MGSINDGNARRRAWVFQVEELRPEGWVPAADVMVPRAVALAVRGKRKRAVPAGPVDAPEAAPAVAVVLAAAP